MGPMLEKRQTTTGFVNDDNDDDGMWGYSTVSIATATYLWKKTPWLIPVQTGVAIKWAVVGALLILLILWLVLGRMHAQRRMRRGQRPMLYHRVSLRQPYDDCTLKPYSYWSRGHNGAGSMPDRSMLPTGLAGAVKAIPCRRILLQVRLTYNPYSIHIYIHRNAAHDGIQPTTPTTSPRPSTNPRTAARSSIPIRTGLRSRRLVRRLVMKPESLRGRWRRCR